MDGVEGVTPVLFLVGHQLPLFLIRETHACFPLHEEGDPGAWREKAMATRLEGEGGVGLVG